MGSTFGSGRAQSPETARGSEGGQETAQDDSNKAFDPTDVFNMDWRSFICKTWHLEPTVRYFS